MISAADSDVIARFCIDCHQGADSAGDLDLAELSADEFSANTDDWETVIRRLTRRQMPPAASPRPSESEYKAFIQSIESKLDSHAVANPQPGRTPTFRRLTRREYENAIRDLLGLQIDASRWLPKDETSHGFDNITVGELSPTLLSRYITAAEKISRIALGSIPDSAIIGDTIRVRPDITQEKHMPGLPLGTRRGAVVQYTFPLDGVYEIRVRLSRDRNEEVEGLKAAHGGGGTHSMDLLIDRQPIKRFEIRPPGKVRGGHAAVDAGLHVRTSVTAGPHDIGVAFLRRSNSLLETKRQPYESRFNMHRHPRTGPAVYQVSIAGPFERSDSSNSPSGRFIYSVPREDFESEELFAREIIRRLAEKAWRGRLTTRDIERPVRLYKHRRDAGDDLETGIGAAISGILVNPRFLFRIERDPPSVAKGQPYKISDTELASRLSFFLWSSIPDGQLLDLAAAGSLSDSETLAAQVRRMLADPRSESLVTDFAGQWLYLRNLDAVSPDMRRYPDFDDNLREAMRRETELFFASILREDRSALDLLRADYTFLNERLAKHYGIPGVFGSRFRRVALNSDYRRGGLLRHGSILTVTSYATRTSPVLRGQWVLENLLGTPAPPPPADVPELKDNTVDSALPLRERLAQHRADPNCSACHDMIDPIGFSLENYDAIGRWRQLDAGQPIDARGGSTDGSGFIGPDGLEQSLLARPRAFVETLTEKLMTYAIGRGMEPTDAPAIRRIVRDAAAKGYRMSDLIVGIAQSIPFQMRTAE